LCPTLNRVSTNHNSSTLLPVHLHNLSLADLSKCFCSFLFHISTNSLLYSLAALNVLHFPSLSHLPWYHLALSFFTPSHHTFIAPSIPSCSHIPSCAIVFCTVSHSHTSAPSCSPNTLISSVVLVLHRLAALSHCLAPFSRHLTPLLHSPPRSRPRYYTVSCLKVIAHLIAPSCYIL